VSRFYFKLGKRGFFNVGPLFYSRGDKLFKSIFESVFCFVVFCGSQVEILNNLFEVLF